MAGIPEYVKAFVNIILSIGIALFCIFAAPEIILFFMPFVLGWFLSVLINPLVGFLEEKMKIKRKAGAALVMIAVMLGFCVLLYGIGKQLVKEVTEILPLMPKMWYRMEVAFADVTKNWSKVADVLPKEVAQKAEELARGLGNEVSVIVGELSFPVAEALGGAASKIPEAVIFVVMCLLSAYFFTVEKEFVSDFLKRVLPCSWKEKCVLLKQTSIDVTMRYVKAQLKIEIWIYLIVALGFMLLKVKNGYVIALPIAFMDMLPILGTGIILIPWIFFKLFLEEYLFALGLTVIWIVGQLVRQLIQPKILGNSMGLDPIPTLVLLYVGYQFAGVTGMIGALPLGILVVTMNEAGFFENAKKSVRILWNGFQKFCRFTEE